MELDVWFLYLSNSVEIDKLAYFAHLFFTHLLYCRRYSYFDHVLRDNNKKNGIDLVGEVLT